MIKKRNNQTQFISMKKTTHDPTKSIIQEIPTTQVKYLAWTKNINHRLNIHMFIMQIPCRKVGRKKKSVVER